MRDGDGPPSGSARRLSRAATVFIAVQIVIPALMLGVRWIEQGSWPTVALPFSWQMYSYAPAETWAGRGPC